MKKVERKIQLSLFSKILFGFIIIILPLYLFIVQINVWSQNKAQKELFDNSQANIKLYLGTLENELRFALSKQLDFINDNDVNNILVQPNNKRDFQFYISAKAIKNKLDSIKVSCKYVSEASIFFLSKDLSLSTSYSSSELPNNLEYIKKKSNSDNYPFYILDGNIVSSITSDFFTSNASKKVANEFIVFIKFNKDEFMKYLVNQQITSNNQNVSLISFKNGITLTNEKNLSLAKVVSDYITNLSKDEISGTKTFVFEQSDYIVSYSKSSALHTALVVYSPKEQFTEILSTYKTWLIILSFITILIVIIFSLWIRSLIITPIKKLVGAYKKLETGDFNVQLKYKRHDEFEFIYERSNETFKKINSLIEDVYIQRIHANEAELKQLQYQINPHFLSNSLIIICNLIKMTDYDTAFKLSQHLGNYYQYITRNSSDFVSLEKEVLHAKNYIEIQLIRFTERFDYQFDNIPNNLENLIVPRLILQPIIENSFKYGFADKTHDGKLIVEMKVINNYLIVIIQDNGNIVDESKINYLNNIITHSSQLTESTGLFNVHRRIQISFGGQSGLVFSLGEYGGLKTEIKIVLDNNKSD